MTKLALAVTLTLILSTQVPHRSPCPKGTVLTDCGCQPPGKRLTWGDCV